MKLIFDILKGAVIGLANIIPGVSGGTMMVAMGVYDSIIYCINHLFKEFKKCMKILWPYAVGMVCAVVALSFVLKWAFANYTLPTNTLFIGLILGGLPAIFKEVRGEKKGTMGVILFVLFAAIVIIPPMLTDGAKVNVTLNVVEIIKLVLLGMLASGTMIIPGVSGSMMLKILGYYEVITTDAVPNLISGLTQGNWAAVGQSVGILVPFALGIVCGIFFVAKMIEVLMRHWKGYTYMAILGMVAASPITILMNGDNYAGGMGIGKLLVSLVTFGIGFACAMLLGADKKEAK